MITLASILSVAAPLLLSIVALIFGLYSVRRSVIELKKSEKNYELEIGRLIDRNVLKDIASEMAKQGNERHDISIRLSDGSRLTIEVKAGADGVRRPYVRGLTKG